MATMRRPQPAPSEVVAQLCVLTTSTARLNFARAPAKPLCRPHLPSPAKMYPNLPSRQSRPKTEHHLLARIQKCLSGTGDFLPLSDLRVNNRQEGLLQGG